MTATDCPDCGATSPGAFNGCCARCGVGECDSCHARAVLGVFCSCSPGCVVLMVCEPCEDQLTYSCARCAERNSWPCRAEVADNAV